ncbi:class I SAM-dependent methyltransferase [Botrimarina hoheduenensis]|uniref:Tellurite methyltransferase n=1 Tax=Botrimarina hoheduenensis TaxID=2528000 RepID=A0A5C5WEF6_9BACT|nr:class I SAM-dependent methyltransferase [Botrimarina hoheduenensis]TWT49000.1 Tellurite methyltransferase [Botrimarina hoheduenensis]
MIAERSVCEPRQLARDQWNREYSTGKIIPSSSRSSPAKALTLFEHTGAFGEGGNALDAGCGNGRNAIYLAELGWNLTAVDASPAAVEIATRSVRRSSVTSRVCVNEQVLGEVWPYADETFDLVLDSYVLCHYSDEEFIHSYLRQMRRTLSPDGIAYSAFFSTSDSYYRAVGLPVADCSNTVVDPHNGLRKRLYEFDELSSLLGEYFKIEAKVDFRFDDTCIGERYERSVLAFLMRR